MRTRWGCIFSYRAHFGDGFAEASGQIHADSPLSEIEIQQHCLDNLPSCPGMPDSVRPEDLVITRFHYTTFGPVLVPDVSQDGQVGTDTPDTARPDTDNG